VVLVARSTHTSLVVAGLAGALALAADIVVRQELVRFTLVVAKLGVFPSERELVSTFDATILITRQFVIFTSLTALVTFYALSFRLSVRRIPLIAGTHITLAFLGH